MTKGDPVDVANFAMMLWYRQERITSSEPKEQPAQAEKADQEEA